MSEENSIVIRGKIIPSTDDMCKEKETGKLTSPITVVSDNSELLSELREAQNQVMMQFIAMPEQNEQPVEYPTMLPVRLLVSKVAEHAPHPDKKPEIARLLLQPFGEYGEREEEKITSFRQQQIINDWMSYNVLGMTVDIWFIKKLDSIRKQQNSNKHDYTLDNLYRVLDNELSRSNSHDGELSQPAKDYFLQNVVVAAFPALVWEPANSILSNYRQTLINSPEWGYINAGLLFAQQLGLNTDDWSIDDSIETGQSLEVLLFQGAAPKEYVGYFLSPALIHHIFTSDKPLEDLTRFYQSDSQNHLMQDVIASYLEFLKNEHDKNNPFECYRKAIDNYQTRPEMAKSILEESFKKNPELYRARGIEDVSDDLINDYLNSHGEKDFKNHLQLKNVDDVFGEQNKEIANHFMDMDKIIIQLFFDKISDDDKSFLLSAKIERAEIENSPMGTLDKFFTTFTPIYFIGKIITKKLLKSQNSSSASIDWLIAQSGDKKRIYGMYIDNKDGGYTIFRGDYTDKIYAMLHSYRDVLLKDCNEPIEKFFNGLSEIHRNNLEKQLYAMGYEATTREKIKDFLLGFIPFYSCIKEARAGNIEDAVLSCTIDVVTVAPVIGVASKIGFNFGKALSHGTRQALRHAAIETTLKSALKAAGSHFVNNGAQLAAAQVAPRELANLGIAALRSLDPGVELLTVGGRKALQGLSRLASKTQDKLPKMKDICNALIIRESDFVEQVVPKSERAFRPDIGKEVSVVHVGNENGRNVWVQVNQFTGLLFGKKYIFNQDDLQLVPITLVRRLASGAASSKKAPPILNDMCLELKSIVTPDVCVKIPKNIKITNPDAQGLRIDERGVIYLKVNSDNHIKLDIIDIQEFIYRVTNTDKYLNFSSLERKWKILSPIAGYPEQLKFFNLDSKAMLTVSTTKWIDFEIGAYTKGKTLTQHLSFNINLVQDHNGLQGKYFDKWRESLISKKEISEEIDKTLNIYDITKLTLQDSSSTMSVFYPKVKPDFLKNKDIFFDSVPLSFDKEKILVSPDDFIEGETFFIYEKEPFNIHVTQQGTTKTCGKTCMLMLALDYKQAKNISDSTISQLIEQISDERMSGKFSSQLSEELSCRKIINELVKKENIKNYLQEKLSSSSTWASIVNIDGHFVVFSSCDTKHFYIRDPYQGILAKEKFEKLNEYFNMEDEIIEIL